MKQYDMTITNLDTDALSFCKKDMSPISKEEQLSLLAELNSIFPDKIKFEHDGYFDTFVVVRAKNYIMYDGKKIKLKGSAFKDLKKEKILKDMIAEFVDCLVFDKVDQIGEVYKKYIHLAKAPLDIKDWAKRATVTKSILNCKGYTEQDIIDKTIRRNETEVWDAIKNIHVQEGDRVLLYPAILSTEQVETPIMRKNRKTDEIEHKGFKTQTVIKYGLKRIEEYNNDADIEHLVSRVWATLKIFQNVIDMERFLNYSLKKHSKQLEDL